MTTLHVLLFLFFFAPLVMLGLGLALMTDREMPEPAATSDPTDPHTR